MSRDDSAGSNIAVFLLGAVAGAVAGLLFAPKSGEETRERLADWLDERRERGAQLLRKAKGVVPEKKDQLAAAFKAGKEAFASAKHNHAEED